MNIRSHNADAAENWLLAALGTLFAMGVVSFAQNTTQQYLGAESQKPQSATQIQVVADEIDKNLYANHVLTAAGQDSCGCPYCCSV